MSDLLDTLSALHDPPVPEPLVTCPNDLIGTDDVRWRMMTAICARTRTMRLEAARLVIRSRSPLISPKQRKLMHSIIEGSGDMLLAKALANGYDGDWNPQHPTE